MATSASWNYSLTAATLIACSLEDIGVTLPGDTVDSDDESTALRALNILVKQWSGPNAKFPGLQMWARQRLTVFLASAQNRFLVGPAAGDDRASVNAIATTLSAAKAANATSITVTSTSGMTAADIVGFVTDAGPLGWGTISTVDSSTGLTIAANTIGAAASGKVVYTYTSKAQRFVHLEAALLRDNSVAGSPIDTPLRVYTDVAQYEALPQKGAAGDPTALLVEYSSLNTVLTTNYSSSNTYKTLRCTVLYPSEDYDATSNDIALPQEYFGALEWELARRLHPKFSGSTWGPTHRASWEAAVGAGVNLNPQNTSAYFQPGRE